MVKAKKYVVIKTFQGVPKKDDFKVVEEELPPLKDGEILVKAEWISVDPYQRNTNPFLPVPYDMFSFQVAVVEETKNPDYPVGTRVVTHGGWRDYDIVNPNRKVVEWTDVFYKLPDLQGVPLSHSVGAVGMPGASAYFAFLEVCKPKPGDTVVVTGAAGAVGTIAGQMAKIKGCKVIGFAGSDEKVQWLEKELGFDKAFNYKTVDIVKSLKEAAPEGVDCYLDNVGGEISSAIMSQMNQKGRVAVVGSISSYNEDPSAMPKVTIIQPDVLKKELSIDGFVVFSRWGRWDEAFADLIQWIKRGDIKPAEHVTKGFDKIFDAFVGMLAGENFGKAVVQI